MTKDELQCWNELAERYLENTTRYESGIHKIHADMLAEIKQNRISEKTNGGATQQINFYWFYQFQAF